MKIKSKISISKTSYAREESHPIRISLYDDDSGVTFFNGRMTMADFTECIMGLQGVDITGEVHQLEHVGMRKIIERRHLQAPRGVPYGKESAWLKDNYKEEGWIVDPYMGAQNSTSNDQEGNTIYHFNVYKFVAVEEAAQ